MVELNKIIRIERPVASASATGGVRWKTIPNGERIRTLAKSAAVSAEDAEQGVKMLHMFHIHHMDGIAAGNRVIYFGQCFRIVEITTSAHLMGLELICEPFVEDPQEGRGERIV